MDWPSRSQATRGANSRPTGLRVAALIRISASFLRPRAPAPSRRNAGRLQLDYPDADAEYLLQLITRGVKGMLNECGAPAV